VKRVIYKYKTYPSVALTHHILPKGITGAARSITSSVSGMSIIHLVIMSYVDGQKSTHEIDSNYSPKPLQVGHMGPCA